MVKGFFSESLCTGLSVRQVSLSLYDRVAMMYITRESQQAVANLAVEIVKC